MMEEYSGEMEGGNLNGLKSVNIELTSRCNKGDGTPGSGCFMCGRRKQENDWPELCDWGDMEFDLLTKIRPQIPKGVFIQWHNNGEPLLYPHLGDAFRLFAGYYMGLDTNGKLLLERSEELKMLSSVTISVIPDDPEMGEQLKIAERYLCLDKRPLVVFRLLGEINSSRKYLIKQWTEKYDKVDYCKRTLHRPEGSFGYTKPVTKPEHGICEEMLHKLAIDRYGNVYPCVRFDPEKKNLLGNVNDCSLLEIWESIQRGVWISHHINHERDKVPLCSKCDFYGVPIGG
jgi:radical SAM protein with 4Fe4S-binding SPASM domain